MMTAREAFIFGWMFGTLRRADGSRSKLGGDFVAACTRPYSGSAKIIREAHEKGLLTGEIDQQIMEAMAEIHSFPDELPEPVQPLELQGEWQRGYYCALSGAPLPPETFDIAAARGAKKLTQAQLADLLGVGQEQVSRWESGKVSPSKQNLDKLRKLLT